MKDKPEDWIDINEAAMILGLSPRGAHYRANRGDIIPVYPPPDQRAKGRDRYFSRKQVEHSRDHWSPNPFPPYDKQPSEADLIYMAGFFDGEGHIGISRRLRSGTFSNHQIRITATNTNKAVIEWIQDTFGGDILPRMKSSVCPMRRQCYQWAAGTRRAYFVLCLIRPHLKVKALQADLAIEFQERLIANGWHGKRNVPPSELQWREELKQRISELNHAGDPPP